MRRIQCSQDDLNNRDEFGLNGIWLWNTMKMNWGKLVINMACERVIIVLVISIANHNIGFISS